MLKLCAWRVLSTPYFILTPSMIIKTDKYFANIRSTMYSLIQLIQLAFSFYWVLFPFSYMTSTRRIALTWKSQSGFLSCFWPICFLLFWYSKNLHLPIATLLTCQVLYVYKQMKRWRWMVLEIWQPPNTLSLLFKIKIFLSLLKWKLLWMCQRNKYFLYVEQKCNNRDTVPGTTVLVNWSDLGNICYPYTAC